MGRGKDKINELLKYSVKRGASDLHLKVNSRPILRINGLLHALEDFPKITMIDTREMAQEISSDAQWQHFEEKREIDMAHSVSGLGRFRVNIFSQRGSIGIVARVIPTQVQQIPDLLLPRVLEALALEPRGLILCTGTTGSGKTTTLASMIDHINRHRTVHILTIEDPIEYLHVDRVSVINQREVGTDTEQFSVAMRSALREDPDVILVGEMRDFATVETALVASETGHLVMSTLHTTDAVETVMRIVSFFPAHQHRQIRLMLASALKAVISQRLIPRADGKGRVPAVEVMINTPLIRECIIDENRTKYILDAMKQGVSQYNMQTFDQSLYYLVKQGLITYQEALERCTNRDDFILKFKGIQSASDLTIEDMEQQIAAGYSYQDDKDIKGLIDHDNQVDN